MNKSKTIRDIFHLYYPYRWTFILITINTCIMCLSDLVYPYVTRWVTNEVIYQSKSEAMHSIIITAMILFILGCIGIITSKIGTKIAYISDKITCDIEQKLFNHYQYMSFTYFDNNKIGELMSVMESDTDRVIDLIYHIPTTITNVVITIIGCCIIFSDINLKLFLLFVPLIPIRLIYEVWIIDKFQKICKESRQCCRDRFTFIEDKLSGIRTTIGFSNQQAEINMFQNLLNKWLNINKRKWKYDWLHDIGSDLFSTIYYMLIHIYGIYLVVNKEMLVGDLVVFYMYSYMIINPFEWLSSLNKTIREGMVSLSKINTILAEKSDIDTNFSLITSDIPGDIIFKHVSFNYRDMHTNVLNDINITIKEGEFLAIVGPSGGGKSTIAGLIPRYYDVSSGKILINNTDIKCIDIQHLRRNIGVLQQDVYLFNGTIYDNIAYGNSNVSSKQIMIAAEKANADEFIRKLPNGYFSEIGERGVKLSGGQKQRIAIARLFLTNPPILIFDEATSSLDNESELAIQKSLNDLFSNRTTIVIAHRLSTIQNADRIIFLDENGIQEEGTHEELMKLNGKYANLYSISN